VKVNSPDDPGFNKTGSLPNLDPGFSPATNQGTPPPQPNYNPQIQSLYKDIVSKEGSLGQNPYGSKYQDLITKFYETPSKHYDDYGLFKGESGDYKFNKNTGKYEKIGDKPKPEEKPINLEIKETEEDGYKVYSKFNPKTGEMEEVSRSKIYHPPTGHGSKTKKTIELSEREKKIDDMMTRYNKARVDGNGKEISAVEQEGLAIGVNVQNEYSGWLDQSTDLGKRKPYLSEQAGNSTDKEEQFNKVYDSSGMNTWLPDLKSAKDKTDWDSKLDYYTKYFHQTYDNKVDPDVWNMLWEEFQGMVEDATKSFDK
jgi:hypothetical protein